MTRNYCCCGSNLKAAKILAIIFIVLRLIQLGLAAYALANFQSVRDQFEGDDIDQVHMVLKISTGLYGFFLLIDICLLNGTTKKIAGKIVY